MPEEWRPVVGYEGLYEVSSLGQVRSVDCVVVSSDGKKKFLKSKLLKQCKGCSRRAYYIVGLSKEGKTTTQRVHYLVAIAFLGDPPKGHVVCHGPKGSFCNELTNITWGTSQKNSGLDRIRDGTNCPGEKNGRAKLNPMQVRVIRCLLESKTMKQKEIGDIFGVAQTTIGYIKRGESWQH